MPRNRTNIDYLFFLGWNLSFDFSYVKMDLKINGPEAGLDSYGGIQGVIGGDEFNYFGVKEAELIAEEALLWRQDFKEKAEWLLWTEREQMNYFERKF